MFEQRRYYTTIELITVIVILGLVGAMAAANFRRIPAFLSLESKISDLKRLMAQARSNAVCRGRNTQLVFDTEKRCFYISQPQSEEKTEAAGSAGIYLPEEIEIKINDEAFGDENSRNAVFCFYPDGTGSGNSMTLQLRKHAFTISVSPLSGSIVDEEVKVSE
ncbi:MAG: hypothetical protein PHV82_06145 [Victivallaceae bacterium]|nr:hypothetical protein [Victivallaceae bacterium]